MPNKTPDVWPSVTYGLKTKQTGVKKIHVSQVLKRRPGCSVVSCHLYDEAFAGQAVCESGVVVVLIEDGNEGRACGAA